MKTIFSHPISLISHCTDRPLHRSFSISMSRVSRLHKTFVASLFLAILTLQAATAATNTVNVGPNFSFSPSSLKVKVGDTVVFNLVGGFHTVTRSVIHP